MKKLDLYLYIVLTALIWGSWMAFPFLNISPQHWASWIALPFLAWIALSVYYFLRWVIRKKSSHQNSISTTEKRT